MLRHLLSPIQRVARRPCRRVRRPTLRRWRDILFLAAVATAVSFFVLPLIRPFGERIGKAADVLTGNRDLVARVGAEGVTWLVLLVILPLLTACWVVLVKAGGLRWGHFPRLLRYPPTWIAAVPALLLLYVLGRILSAETHHAVFVRVMGGMLLMVLFSGLIALRIADGPAGVAAAVRHIYSKLHRRAPSGVHLSEFPSAEDTLAAFAQDPERHLIPWFEDDDAVASPEQDCFGSRFIAERIAALLRGHTLSPIGLIGPWGSGKSTVLRLVDYYLNEHFDTSDHRLQGRKGADLRGVPLIITCTVSAWGLEQESVFAVVLRQAIGKLARFVDCLALRNLPARYTAALKAVGPAWSHLPLTLLSTREPTEQLRRLDPILRAINARLVVFIEDLDRNEGAGPTMPLATAPNDNGATHIVNVIEPAEGRRLFAGIAGMLDRLHQVENVSFVLAVSRTVPGVDFERLCVHHEELHRLETRLTWKVAGSFVDLCRSFSERQGDVPPRGQFSSFDFGESRWNILAHLESALEADISALLGTPRGLKRALRKTWLSWQAVHGETDFDDLFLCSIIRTVSPRAFDFLWDNHASLARASQEPSKTTTSNWESGPLRERLTTEWHKRVTDCPEEHRQPLWRFVCFLFPGMDQEVGSTRPRPVQGIHQEPYWDRASIGRIGESGVRDQVVLRDVLAWKHDKTEGSLPESLVADDQYTGVFERLQESDHASPATLSPQELRELVSQLFGLIVERKDDLSNPEDIPGFIPMWRIMKRRGTGEGHADWLWSEIENALPKYLALANAMHSYWGSSEYFSLNAQDSQFLRHRMTEWAREGLTSEVITRTLSRKSTHALRRLVRNELDGRRFIQANAKKWSWLSPRLTKAIILSPDVVGLQAAHLVSKSEERSEPRGKGEGKMVTLFALDRDVVQWLIPKENERRDFLNALVHHPIDVDGLDPQERALVTAIQDEAKKWLNEGKEGQVADHPDGETAPPS